MKVHENKNRTNAISFVKGVIINLPFQRLQIYYVHGFTDSLTKFLSIPKSGQNRTEQTGALFYASFAVEREAELRGKRIIPGLRALTRNSSTIQRC